jgi:membrane-associated phospholipid phosphatase
MVLLLAVGFGLVAAAAAAWAFARGPRTRRQSPGLRVAAAVVGGGGAIGVLLAMVETNTGLARLDGAATRFGAHHATDLSTDVLRAVTQLGDAAVLVPLTVIVGLLEVRRRRDWRPAAFLLVAVGGQFGLSTLVKAVVGRARPDLLRLTAASGPSFPSGHATASAATFAALAWLVGTGRSRPTTAWLGAAAVGIAVAVGATRVLLGVHWLTDVAAGLLLGWTWFAVCSIVFGGRLRRPGAPVVMAQGSNSFTEP